MRRWLAVLALLLGGCTDLQRQAARDSAARWAACAAVQVSQELSSSVADGLRSAEWRDRLIELSARSGARLVDCAVAEVVRSAQSLNRPGDTLQVQAFAPARSERQAIAERGGVWLRERGFQVLPR